MALKHEWFGGREHEDKGCGYGESLPFQHHEEITNFCFSFPSALCFPPVSLSLSFKKFLPGNSDLEHQKEMTAEYVNFYINSTPKTHSDTSKQTYCTNTCFHAVNTVVAVCCEGFFFLNYQHCEEPFRVR